MVEGDAADASIGIPFADEFTRGPLCPRVDDYRMVRGSGLAVLGRSGRPSLLDPRRHNCSAACAFGGIRVDGHDQRGAGDRFASVFRCCGCICRDTAIARMPRSATILRADRECDCVRDSTGTLLYVRGLKGLT